MERYSFYAYVMFILAYRLSENIVIMRYGSWKRRFRKDWTLWIIVVPYLLVVITPMLEYFRFQPAPGPLNRLFGGLLFLAGTFFRVKGHLDLKQGFSPFVEKVEGQQLVQTGLYKHIRHPLYIGTILLFLACPLFLAARFAWIFTIGGIIGVLVRIRREERFLCEEMPGYREYMKRTRALLPRIY